MAKYNLTKVAPEGFIHHHAFDEVRESLGWALASLGHEASITENWFSETSETNIIFGSELIEFQRIPKNSIIYNLEQPAHPNMKRVRELAKESGCTVWDYSHRAIAEWKLAGIDAIYVPIGYTLNLTRIVVTDPLWDCCFFGWMTDRRRGLIDKLKSDGLRVFASAACYGGGRDYVISRSKVCLNVHHDGRDRWEAVRCSYLMANSSCIVTEISSDDDEYSDLANGLARAPYRLLADTVASYAASSTERHALMGNAFNLISERDFAQSIYAALDSTPAPKPTPAIFHAVERQIVKRDYLAEARQLRSRDPRVAARFKATSEHGDMKDFVQWMREHAKGNVVEIGVRDGASTSAFLAGVEENGGHVYSIDCEPCQHLFEGHPQWSFLQANSTDLQKIIKFIPFQVDVLLIDGDHSRAGVINDFEYQRQVRAGGLVLFHDILPEEKPSGCTDMSWPSDDVKNVYWELCRATEPMGWTHEEPPGRYGLGVLRKPPMVPPPAIEVSEIETRKAALVKIAEGALKGTTPNFIMLLEVQDQLRELMAK